jgi:hypothetical protein
MGIDHLRVRAGGDARAAADVRRGAPAQVQPMRPTRAEGPLPERAASRAAKLAEAAAQPWKISGARKCICVGKSCVNARLTEVLDDRLDDLCPTKERPTK